MTGGTPEVRSDKDILRISQRYPQDILKISQRYPQDILKISPRYPKDTPKISQDTPKISPRYPQWTNGSMEYWNIGTLKHLNIGKLDYWNIGTLEHWIIETLQHSTFNQHLVRSIALIRFKRLGMTLVTSIASRDWVKNWKSGLDLYLLDHHHYKSSCRS